MEGGGGGANLSSPQYVSAPSLGWHQLVWWSPQLGEGPGRQETMIQTFGNEEASIKFTFVLYIYPRDPNHPQTDTFTLQPQYIHKHDATVNSFQEDCCHFYLMICCWYIPHQGTPHWPATLLVMSSPPWLYGQIEYIYIIILHYKLLLLTIGYEHLTSNLTHRSG